MYNCIDFNKAQHLCLGIGHSCDHALLSGEGCNQGWWLQPLQTCMRLLFHLVTSCLGTIYCTVCSSPVGYEEYRFEEQIQLGMICCASVLDRCPIWYRDSLLLNRMFARKIKKRKFKFTLLVNVNLGEFSFHHTNILHNSWRKIVDVCNFLGGVFVLNTKLRKLNICSIWLSRSVSRSVGWLIHQISDNPIIHYPASL